MKHLINNYFLDTDAYNYILTERRLREGGKNQGSEYYEIVGYYGTNLKLLLTKLIDLYMLEHIQNIDYEKTLDFIKEVIDLKERLME